MVPASPRRFSALKVLSPQQTVAEANLQAGPGDRRTVLLVSLDWSRPKDPRTPLGQASLLAALRAADQCDAIGISEPMNQPGFRAEAVVARLLRLAEGQPADHLDIAIGVYVWNDHHVRTILRQLRQQGCRARIILGGPQISYAGAGLESFYPEADVFVRGYGEQALVKLSATSAHQAIEGVHWAGTPDSGLQAQVDLAQLPSPFSLGIVDLHEQRFVRWETQRGCRYRCSFCQHREAGARLKRRQLASERLREEIALFVRHGVEDVAVLDPIFNDGPHYLDVLAEFQHQGYRGRLSLQCRFELVNDAFLDACQALRVRLEFGLQTIHADEGRVVQRGNRLDKVRAVIAELHRRGIVFEVSLIFGLPNQTLESFRASVEFCLQHRVPTIRAFPLMLLRGTKLEQERAAYGLTENQDAIPAVVSSHTFDEDSWRRMAALAGLLDQTEGRHPADLAGLDALDPIEKSWPTRFSPTWPDREQSAAI